MESTEQDLSIYKYIKVQKNLYSSFHDFICINVPRAISFFSRIFLVLPLIRT